MRIALDGRRILLEQALAAWPRRGTTLVEINCGAGFLQQSLRADGFDVTGCEPSDFLRRRFAEVNGSHFTVEAGHSDLLPFDSESFDWGILHLGECLSPQQIDASLRELLRVVSLGFAITFWNRTSLAGRSASFPPDFPLYPAWSILRRLAWHGLGTFRARSALSGPVSTWRAADAGLLTAGEKFWGLVNRPLPLPTGFCCVFRVELGPRLPMTMRPLRVKRRKFSGEALARCGEGSGL
ncbi:MAG: class I SAM-dependent methyltransferase [Desulfovibrio sp.]|nr:class I SAM-dependent methyltransferase [Desulfovibrio sp.]